MRTIQYFAEPQGRTEKPAEAEPTRYSRKRKTIIVLGPLSGGKKAIEARKMLTNGVHMRISNVIEVIRMSGVKK